jgi:hypothetical protein
MTTTEQTSETMSNTHVSVIIGPTFDSSRSVGMYVLDNHHILAALDYSKQKRIGVIFDVICDWRTMTNEEFWLELSTLYTINTARTPGNMTFLPSHIEVEELPTYFSFKTEDISFGDDSYMSLAAFSTSVLNATANCPAESEACMRCFYSACERDGSSTFEMDIAK